MIGMEAAVTPAAVQLFGYADLLYHPQTEVRILRDDEAMALRRWLM